MNYHAAYIDALEEDGDSERSLYTEQELLETPNQRKARLQAEKAAPVAKGCCKKCGEHIGRGLWRHEQSCGGAK